MTILLTIIIFLLIFSVLVIIHELGHFLVARKAGIKVEEFGFGLPPRIWGVKKGETLYSLNAIPFGGFVRLFGEDASDPKAKKNPRSFSAKPAWVRILVIVAGVVMNFLLAWFLLTIGFIVGIQPLILSSDEGLNAIQNGTIQIQSGVTVESVQAGGAAEKAGMKVGDRITTLDGKKVSSIDELQVIIKNSSAIVDVERSGANGALTHQFLNLQSSGKEGLGFAPYELVFFPRLVVQKMTSGDLRADDVIERVNDQEVYTYEDYVTGLTKAKKDGRAVLSVWRGTQKMTAVLDLNDEKRSPAETSDTRVMISDILSKSPAEKAALRVGDIILQVNGQDTPKPQDVQTLIKAHKGEALTYFIERNGQTKSVPVEPDKTGFIGVNLAALYLDKNNVLDLYQSYAPTTILKINDVQYPLLEAPFRALQDSFRLSGFIVASFGDVLRSFVTKFAIPEGVAGPVGIAQLTYMSAQQGLPSLLRLVVMLSLSLAIMNILPFPALDGGRLFFILVEVVTRRKISGKWEARVHAIGFLLLMILIVAVTYGDIVKLF